MACHGFCVALVQTQQIAPDGGIQIACLDIFGQVRLVRTRWPPIGSPGCALTAPTARTARTTVPGRARRRARLIIPAGSAVSTVGPATGTEPAIIGTGTRSTASAEVAPPPVATAIVGAVRRSVIASLPRSAARLLPTGPGATTTKAPRFVTSAARTLAVSRTARIIGAETTALLGATGPVATFPRRTRPFRTATIGAKTAIGAERAGVVPAPAAAGRSGPAATIPSGCARRTALTPEISPSTAGRPAVTGFLAAGTRRVRTLTGPPEPVPRPGRITPERFPAIALFRHGGSLSQMEIR